MIRFPIQQFLDENKCYEFLVEILHQEGLRCPSCKTEVDNCRVHRRDRAPVLYYRCSCGRILNAFTETDWQGTHHSCSKILCILKGIVQGIPTLHLAKELGIDRKHLLERRHRIQSHLMNNSFHGIFSDKVIEVDEMYQNAGKKRCTSF